ncbi:hypothetical protein T12_1327 [Trichinella patagoniensis]|uniref:Uncharacterized protein n=1 Tax=Trichinella patagoniensis TaxID=990121 RepID=A0A0V0YZR6_9BILA|nr:hypothetical protein T12_6006 [Trichinella patagoniensis]KRY05753.1 hypothetical protein T12_13639 [Trichinella patagoniensis]KRY05852.1 hypothetical protein T12_1327 [Trichinella patagoniensis]
MTSSTSALTRVAVERVGYVFKTDITVRFQYKTFPTLQWLTSTPHTVFKLPVDAANVLD